MHLALDRIEEAVATEVVAYRSKPAEFSPETYYQDIVGVTVNNSRPARVHLLVSSRHAPYVETKPLHSSQQVVARHPDGSIELTLLVRHNFELERELLGFGAGIKILGPEKLKNLMADFYRRALSLYVEEERKPV